MELPKGFTLKVEQLPVNTFQKRRGKRRTFQSPEPDLLVIRFDPQIKMAQLERYWILSAVEYCSGSISAAAKMLGMAKETVYRKVRKYREAK